MNIYDVASRKLATSMKTEKEIKDFLKSKGFPQKEIDTLIKEFLECGYLNDVEYGVAYLRMAFRKGRSKDKAFMELDRKGVSANHQKKALETLKDEEGEDFDSDEERGYRELMKAMNKLGLEENDFVDEKNYGKLGRRLASLGYKSSVIYSLLRRLNKKPPNNYYK